MDFDNPVIAKLFDRHFGQKLAEETEKRVAEETQKLAQVMEQRYEKELTLVNHQVAEAARREAEAEVARREAEAEAANQWQALMLKVLEHRFQSVPVALIVLLQAVTPDQRSQVADLILDAPDVGQCLQGLRQLQSSKS